MHSREYEGISAPLQQTDSPAGLNDDYETLHTFRLQTGHHQRLTEGYEVMHMPPGQTDPEQVLSRDYETLHTIHQSRDRQSEQYEVLEGAKGAEEEQLKPKHVVSYCSISYHNNRCVSGCEFCYVEVAFYCFAHTCTLQTKWTRLCVNFDIQMTHVSSTLILKE